MDCFTTTEQVYSCHFHLSCLRDRRINLKMAQQVLLVCLVKFLLISLILPFSLQNVDYPQEYHTVNGNGYAEEIEAAEQLPSSIEGASQEPGLEHVEGPATVGSNEGTGNADTELAPESDSPPEPEIEVANTSGETVDAVSDPEIIVVQHIDEPVTTEALESDAEEVVTEAPESEAEAESGDDNGGDDDGDDDNGDGGDDDSGGGGGCTAAADPPVDSNDELKDKLTSVSDKIEQLFEAVNSINSSIDRMESLMQSTIVDERIYKCISAINSGNQSQAVKYWKQILRYQSNPSKKSTILRQIVKDAYVGKEENILSVIQFIDSTQEYYGYETLHKELETFNQIYHHRSIFSLAHYIKKGCGRNSDLFKLMPSAVQSVNSNFFTLQSKFNKGYLYYAKRCVARHYYYCLDVLTKKVETAEMEFLDSEEKKRYHWKLNATDDTVTKFFILNQDKYWAYRLQDVNNSPRFKMEDAGNSFEIEWAHFQLELNSDDEIVIQVRETNIYLEGEEFKFENTSEVLLHSFYKSDKLSTSERIFWLVKPVDEITDLDTEEHENCKVENGGDGQR